MRYAILTRFRVFGVDLCLGTVSTTVTALRDLVGAKISLYSSTLLHSLTSETCSMELTAMQVSPFPGAATGIHSLIQYAACNELLN